jgi:hypothetical protein
MLSEEKKEVLLQEYDLCDKHIGRLDTLIWQTASLIYPISLAGFTYFGIASTHTPDRFFAVLAVGIGSVTLLVIWYMLSRLWFRFQSIAFYRMVEIEDEIEYMWRFRYSSFMGKPNTQRKKAFKKMDDEEQSRYQKLDNLMGDFRGIGLRPAAAYVTLIFVFGWVATIIREYVITFHP